MTVPTTPAFCFITPTAYLDEFATKSTRHLVLAHLVDKDPVYANFYKTRRELGDYIMMDNSAYELKVPYDPAKLIELGGKCGANAIVLPDYPFQPAAKTIEAAEEFIPQFVAAGYEVFFIPQSTRGDLDGWIEAYDWATDHPDIDIIGMSILGIPNALPNIDPAFARVVMAQLLLDRGIFCNKAHHWLGLNAGAGLEIPSLLRLKVLTSVDSSGPVWAALMGHAYTIEADSLQLVKKLKSPVDFSLPMTKDKDTIARIHHNVNLTLDLFKQTEQKAWYAAE